MKMPYSVFRVCATYEQFQKYGSSPRGVVGWFSPRSKELVVFQGGDSRMRKKGYVETVTITRVGISTATRALAVRQFTDG